MTVKKIAPKNKMCHMLLLYPTVSSPPFAVNCLLVWSWGCAEQSFTFCYQTVFTIQLPPHNVLQKLIWNIYPLFRLWNIKVQQTKNCFSQTFTVQARHGSDVWQCCTIPRFVWSTHFLGENPLSKKSCITLSNTACMSGSILSKVFRLRTVVGETNTSKGTI